MKRHEHERYLVTACEPGSRFTPEIKIQERSKPELDRSTSINKTVPTQLPAAESDMQEGQIHDMEPLEIRQVRIIPFQNPLLDANREPTWRLD